MSLTSRLRSLWRNITRRSQVEQDLDDELRTYVELVAAEKVERGEHGDQAIRKARLELGNVNSIKEQVRESRAGASLQSVVRDLRYAARALSRRRLFAATAILSLSIGIGAATAVYSWGSFMFFRPPTGVAHPKTLVAIYLDDRDPETEPNIISLPHFEELRAGQAVLNDMAGAFRYWASLSPGQRVQEVSVEFVTGTFFSTVGTPTFIGRGIGPSDDVPGAPLSAVLSHELWRAAFGGMSDILGQTLRLNGHTLTIVGVTPADFEGLDYSFYGKPQVWTATHAYTPLVGTNRVTRRSALLRVVGRLKPGVTPQAAEAALNVPAAQLSYEPTDFRRYTSAHVVPIHEARLPIYTRPNGTPCDFWSADSTLVVAGFRARPCTNDEHVRRYQRACLRS